MLRRHSLARTLLATAAAVLLAACQTPVRLMPTPAKLSAGEVDPFKHDGPDAQGNEVPVLYATNRLVLLDGVEPVFTIVPSDTLRLGVAQVRIGDETLSWERLHALSLSPATDASRDDARPVVAMTSTRTLGTLWLDDDTLVQPFIDEVNRLLAASPEADLLIYVHGVNFTAARAAAQASQLRHFTGRRTVVLAFMWPSAGSFLRYATDVVAAAASVPALERLIELLGTRTSARRLDILAYSAGAQITSPVLARLGEGRPGESREALRQRLRLGRIYFAAPDIDTRQAAAHLRRYVDVVDRVVLAANLNDIALRLSTWKNRGSRAGRPDVGELSVEQTEFIVEATRKLDFDLLYIDPGAIPDISQRSHTFWYDTPWVSSDIIAMLLFDADPQQRGLERQTTPTGSHFWTFPADYDRRAKDFVRQRLPARLAPDPTSAGERAMRPAEER